MLRHFLEKQFLLFQRHMTVHTNPEVHECPLCGIGIAKKYDMKRHFQSKHNVNKKHDQEDVESLRCSECHVLFPSKYWFYVHKRNIHGGKDSECHVLIPSKYWFYVHKRNIHGSKDSECHVLIASKYWFYVHKRNIHGGKDSECHVLIPSKYWFYVHKGNLHKGMGSECHAVSQ